MSLIRLMDKLVSNCNRTVHKLRKTNSRKDLHPMGPMCHGLASLVHGHWAAAGFKTKQVQIFGGYKFKESFFLTFALTKKLRKNNNNTEQSFSLEKKLIQERFCNQWTQCAMVRPQAGGDSTVNELNRRESCKPKQVHVSKLVSQI